jgi:hypothetical protein
VRSTIGTLVCPPNMKRALAAWFTSASMPSVMKSMNMISTTGLRPPMAAPTAADSSVASLIGVSRTRSGPNASSRPRVTPKLPPAMAMSSPNTTTFGSAVMASFRAWPMALP